LFYQTGKAGSIVSQSLDWQKILGERHSESVYADCHPQHGIPTDQSAILKHRFFTAFSLKLAAFDGFQGLEAIFGRKMLQNYFVPSQNNTGLSQDHFELFQNNREPEQNNSVLPENHLELKQNHLELEQNNSVLS